MPEWSAEVTVDADLTRRLIAEQLPELALCSLRGEDIVLTWTLMDARGIVQYEPLASSSTAVPMRLGDFMRQRSRWARGMFEGLRTHPPRTQPRVLAKSSPGSTTWFPGSTSESSSSGARR